MRDVKGGLDKLLILPFLFLVSLPSVLAVQSPIFKTPLYFLVIPVGFRATCYYFRGFYSKYVFGKPWSCANRPMPGKYRGEIWIQKLHRYFWYGAIILLVGHAYDAIFGIMENGGHFYFSNVLEWLDVIFLSLYVMSCHCMRYFAGSKEQCFSCKNFAPARFKTFKFISWLNAKHGAFFWISIVTIITLEIYLRLVNADFITDFMVL